VNPSTICAARWRNRWLAASVLAGMGLASAGALAQTTVPVGNGASVPTAPGNGDTWELQTTANAPALVTLPSVLNITGLATGSTITFSNPGQLRGSGATLNIAGATALAGGAGGLNMIYDTTGPLTVGVSGTFILTGNTITDGTNFRGSAIYSNGDINLGTNAGVANVTVTNNNVTTTAAADLINQFFGGAVFSNTGNIAIGNPTSTVVLSGNHTTNVGAAVYTDESTGGTITVQGSAITIDGNTAGIHTGAIYTGNEGKTITIGNSDNSTSTILVNNNVAQGSGGAIQAAWGQVTVNAATVTLTNNEAQGWAGDSSVGSGSGSGGAILGSRLVTVGNANSAVTATGNTAEGRGGAIYTSNKELGDVVVNGATINLSNNTASTAADFTGYTGFMGGGAIYSNSTIEINGGAITLNGNKTLRGSGGALEAEQDITITGSLTASNNHADSNQGTAGALEGIGGVIWAGHGVTLNATGAALFDSNSAYMDGGAIRAGGNVALNATGGDITFQGNTDGSGNRGSAIWFQNSYQNTPSDAVATFSTPAAGGNIYFYDSIANNATNGPFTVNKTGPGTVLFDGAQHTNNSPIYGATEVQAGTFVVRNGAVYGALGSGAVPTPQDPGTSSFTVPTDTTLVGGKTGTVQADSFTLEGMLDISGSHQPTTSPAYSAAGTGATQSNYSVFNVASSSEASFDGSTIKFNTWMDDGSSKASDLLVIDMNDTTGHLPITGTGTVAVTPTGGPGALTTGDGIEVIRVLQGTTKDGDFTLQGGSVVRGNYVYTLARGTIAPNSWFLQSKQLPPGGGGGGAAAVPTLGDAALALLALALAAGAVVTLRRRNAVQG